tara:strand:+ start:1861 stop:2103 length:243 start_codon:yes stop_codon:yes gene_type:complete
MGIDPKITFAFGIRSEAFGIINQYELKLKVLCFPTYLFMNYNWLQHLSNFFNILTEKRTFKSKFNLKFTIYFFNNIDEKE